MFESFSTNALTIIDEALKIARSMNKKLVGTEHLLLALYKKKDTICHFLLEEKDLILTQEDFLTLYPIITSTFDGNYLSPIIVCIELLNTKQEILKQFKTFINPTITQPKVSIITNNTLQAKKAYILTTTPSNIVKITIV